MQRCPNCRARKIDGDVCGRCGMELSMLKAAERCAEHHLQRGLVYWVAGDVSGALAQFSASRRLSQGALVEALLLMAEEWGKPAKQQ